MSVQTFWQATGSQRILEAAKTMDEAKKGWAKPFGDGKTGSRIINILMNELE